MTKKETKKALKDYERLTFPKSSRLLYVKEIFEVKTERACPQCGKVNTFDKDSHEAKGISMAYCDRNCADNYLKDNYPDEYRWQQLSPTEKEEILKQRRFEEREELVCDLCGKHIGYFYVDDSLQGSDFYCDNCAKP